jgi:hypothetical protein
MRRFLRILLLFVGLSLLLLGGIFIVTGLFPYAKVPSGPCWPIIALGTGLTLCGWAVARTCR